MTEQPAERVYAFADEDNVPVVFDTFSALAGSHAITILAFIAGRPSYVGEIAEYLGVPQPTVSKRLAVMKRAGLVTVQQEGASRRYSLNEEVVGTISEFLDCLVSLAEHSAEKAKFGSNRQRAQAVAIDVSIAEVDQSMRDGERGLSIAPHSPAHPSRWWDNLLGT